jgi:hypothetical protein
MRKSRAVIVSFLAVTVVFWLLAGVRQNSIRDSAFVQTAIGDTEVQVLGRFGPPDYVEPIGQPYLRYTGAPCEAPCQSRLWWEDAIFPGIGVWSVELGADHTVTHTARWVSP